MLPVMLSVDVRGIAPLQLKLIVSLALSVLAWATSACNWLSLLQFETVMVVAACAGSAGAPATPNAKNAIIRTTGNRSHRLITTTPFLDSQNASPATGSL